MTDIASIAAWTPRTVAVWQEYRRGTYRIFKTSFYGEWHFSDAEGVLFSDEYLQTVMEFAARHHLQSLPSGDDSGQC